jgi:hypothetical protein
MKKNIILFLIFLLTGCAARSSIQNAMYPSEPAKRALIISINDYKDKPLKGPVSDGNNMIKILKKYLSFSADEIKFLKNEEATRDGILETFDNWLINGTRPGDKIFIYYSGHGSRIKDQNGDEDDGYDEALCPYDVHLKPYEKMITDDEIGEKLDILKDRSVVIIFDSCHSGTAMRDPNITPRFLDFYPDESARGLTRGLTRGVRESSQLYDAEAQKKGSLVLLSAASAEQVAYEIKSGEERHGLLTYSIIRSFEEEPYQTISFAGIKDRFYKTKEKLGVNFDQDPYIDGNKELAKLSLKEVFNPLGQNSYKTEPEKRPPKIFRPESSKSITDSGYLWVNEKHRTKFVASELLRFHVHPGQDGYLYLFDLAESSEEMYLIYPNPCFSGNTVRENEEIVIPPVNKEKCEFRASKGKDKIIAVIAKKTWTEMDAVVSGDNLFVKLTPAQKSQVLELMSRPASGDHQIMSIDIEIE